MEMHAGTGGYRILAKGLPMRSSLVALVLLLAALSIPSTAYAYVDPGTGSYFLQILLAGLLGAAFAVRFYWRRIKSFLSGTVFGRNKGEEERQTGEDGKG
jgi:hypothetical protein